MKKQFLLLAGSAVLFASCGSNNNPTQTQAQIDSTVNAKLAQHDADNAHKNDSIINAEAKLKAEAEHRNHEHADKKDEGNNANNSAAPAPAAAPPATTPPPPQQTGMRAHSDQNQNNPNNNNAPAKPQGGGLRAHSDQNQGH